MKTRVERGRGRPRGERDGTTAQAAARPAAMADALLDNLRCLQAKLPQHATRNDWYMALAYTVRDRMLANYITTVESIAGSSSAKVVAYLSAEFLTGPHLGNSLVNLGLWDAAREAVSSVGQDLATLVEQEEEPGLGNGGLGRLAACYMDSLATLERAGDRLRHPLRVRHLRSGDPRRLAGRADRQVAALRQPVGDRPLGDDVQRAVRRPHRAVPRRTRQPPGALVARSDREGRRLRHAGARLSRARRRTCCGCGRRKPPSRSTSTRSTSATTTARSNEKIALGNHLQGALSERRARDRQAAAARAAVLLRLLLAAGHDPPASDPRQAARRVRLRTGPRSSTTPTRRSPSPS